MGELLIALACEHNPHGGKNFLHFFKVEVARTRPIFRQMPGRAHEQEMRCTVVSVSIDRVRV